MKLVKCFMWSVALYGAKTWTLRRNEQKDWKPLRCKYEKDGACKIDRQNKKCSCARKNGRRKNNVGTDKEEEEKLSGPLAKEELPADGCS